MKHVDWQPWEDEYLQEHYPIEGGKYIQETALNHKTLSQIYGRARELNLHAVTCPINSWHESEIQIVKEVYPIKGAQGVHELLTHRTHGAILRIAALYEVHKSVRQKSTNAVTRRDYILTNIDKEPLNEIASKCGISIERVLVICSRYGSVELYRRKRFEWIKYKKELKKRAS